MEPCAVLSRVWLVVTPCTVPGSSVHGISQARIPEQVTISCSMGSSPRDLELMSLGSPSLQTDSLLLSHPGFKFLLHHIVGQVSSPFYVSVSVPVKWMWKWHFLTGLFRGLKELIHAKHLEQWQAHNKLYGRLERTSYNFRNLWKKAVASVSQERLQSKQLMFTEHLQSAWALHLAFFMNYLTGGRD